MAIQHLIAYFDRWARPETGEAPRLCFDDRGASGRYGRWTLYSVFQPIFPARGETAYAYEGLLRVEDEYGQAVPLSAPFAAAGDGEVVVLDRLCRVVHALNFVTQDEHGPALFLNVHGRHLLSIGYGQHGAAFETLLGYCGVSPRRVILEILESHIDDLDKLQAAMAAYRAKGFRVALDDFGTEHSNVDRLWKLAPDVVKLDRALIVEATHNARARRVFPRLVELIHELGADVIAEGVETAEQYRLALDAGVDGVQGFHLARPAAQLATRPDAPALAA